MIYYVSTGRFSSTIRRFLKHYGRMLGGCLKSLTWEEIFFERGGPIGHYIFTDFDRLSRYELDCAAAFALSLEKAAPEARMLNHPLKVLDRYPLLVKLHEAGINDFTATRLEAGERPPKYPVFIRAEDGYGGPETDVLNNDAEFDAALDNLKRRGLPVRGRIAIGYAAERGAGGYFRKYAAFNVGGDIIPTHIVSGRTWVVKSRIKETDWIERRDKERGLRADVVSEELAYLRENPHRDVLAKSFELAGIQFGRVDYGVVNHRVQIYEINTNPKLPSPEKGDRRDDRRRLVSEQFLRAVSKADGALQKAGKVVAYRELRPRAHDLHLPRGRLFTSLSRRAFRLVTPRES